MSLIAQCSSLTVCGILSPCSQEINLSTENNNLSLSLLQCCHFKKGSKPRLVTSVLQITSLEGTIESVSHNIYISHKPDNTVCDIKATSVLKFSD